MYFKAWWVQQNDTVKNQMRKHIQKGRWEFFNGGWVATDEACPSFRDLLENIIVGHEFLWNEFKVRPKIAW